MNETESRSRRRGVRASRIKLTRALADAGLKTQAALADRIADLEGLDSAPKDIVSRVFREQPVDPPTLERVARALGTEAYKLYLAVDDAPMDPPTRPIAPASVPENAPEVAQSAPAELPEIVMPPPTGRRPTYIGAGVVVVTALLAVIGWQWFQARNPAPAEVVAVEGSRLQPRFGRFKVAVTQFAGDESGELGVLVRERLENTLGVTSAALPVIANEDRSEVARRFRADVVLDGEIVRVGQLLAVRAFAYVESRGRREQIWGETFAAAGLARKLPLSADRITAAVHRLLGLPAGEARNPPHFALAPVQDEYLRARLYLDQPPSEINLRRAAGNFESALRHDANYAAAHAGLCEVALDAVWIDNEQQQLANAEKSCIRAMQLDPGAPETLRAHAYFLDRSGRAAEAVEILRQAREREPDDMETMLALANAEFDLYRRTGEAKWGEASLQHARQATRITPKLWKPYMWLGVYESAAGSLDNAIAALQQAYALDQKNEYVVTNLGTMYFCRGDFDEARDLYLQARKVAPGSYAGDEFLGMVYYYLRDFGESARLRQTAIDTARGGGTAEIHQMWGALGDSYRQAGDGGRAINAYVRALEIVERDFLMGNGTSSDKASRAYYYLTLAQLDPQRAQPPAVIAALDKDLETAYRDDVEAAALLRVTQSWLLKKKPAKAREALLKATRRCPCYMQYPDFETIAAR